MFTSKTDGKNNPCTYCIDCGFKESESVDEEEVTEYWKF